MKEYVLCAAIWYKDAPMVPSVYWCKNIDKGIVLCGWRHNYIIGQCLSLLGKKQYEMGEYVQGFITNQNRFLNREEACELFKQNGGIPQYTENELFSEDLY